MNSHHLRARESFLAALDYAPEARESFVRKTLADEPVLADEVLELLSLHEQLQSLEAGDAGQVDDFVGAHVGPYQIANLVGAGGMGRIYLAHRVDGTFRRDVAIKLIKLGKDTDDEMLRRFDQEGRILATLHHPNIATLFDAGRTSDDRMYIVMEYVDGKPLTGYCEEQVLDARARVDIFLKVADAVSYAHRHLVVHRDLKPANILVDGNGEPKLLDFGIAKWITRAGNDLAPTTPLLSRGTPGYVSPERLAGFPVQTAMDVFSLGVVLHELLTGVRPREKNTSAETRSLSQPLLASEALEQAVRAGTRGAAGIRVRSNELRGDLDAIIEKAIESDVQDRYRSVDELTADLHAWIGSRPVSARRAGALYRFGKFVRRNPVPIAASAAVLLALLITSVTLFVLWQVSEEQRRRDARQLSAVGRLASRMFDVESSLARVSGTTELRRLIADSLGGYLRAIEAGGSPSLMLDTAVALRRLGDIEGNPNTPNLGDRDAALKAHDSALGILSRLRSGSPNDTRVLEELAKTYLSRGEVRTAREEFDSALSDYKSASTLVDGLLRVSPGQASYKGLQAALSRSTGDIRLASNDASAALSDFERALAIENEASPGDRDHRAVALTQVRIGAARAALGASAEARSQFEMALATLEQVASEQAGRRDLLRDIAVGLTRLGKLRIENGDDGGRADVERAVRILRALVAEDAADARTRRDLMVSLVTYGYAVGRADPVGRLAAYREARTLSRSLSTEALLDRQRQRELEEIQRLLAGETFEPRVDLLLSTGSARSRIQAGDRPPEIGTAVVLSPTLPTGWHGYVIVFGASGGVEILDDAALRRANWTIPASGPLPSETILLVASPKPLERAELEKLQRDIASVDEPRVVDFDSHIVWNQSGLRLDSQASSRGAPRTQWVDRIRSRILALPNVQMAGRTFPLTSAVAEKP